MRAWTQTSAGLPKQVLKLTSNIPIPDLKPNEILVKISHAALNPGGVIIMKIVPMIFRTAPSIPEMDFAGTIIKLGPDVPKDQEITLGTRVFGSIAVGQNFTKGKGALAEYAIVTAENICRTPEKMKDEEAAGLGIVGTSALALLDRASVKEGDNVLINGASGGIGTLLVQMVKDVVGKGGKVVALCSGKNAELVTTLGADEVIDYREHAPVHKYLTERFSKDPFDWVLDAVGVQDLWLHCASYLKPGRPFITIGNSLPPDDYSYSSILYGVGQMISNAFWPRFLGGVNRPWGQVTGIANLKAMRRLVHMIDEDKLKVITDSVWSFQDVLLAYERLMSKHARGKVIIRLYHADAQ
ncbi:hypothetical protein EG329_002000 [Mollisiaceae sp. DMI_Dod_QoI]|nr:hypothetical protein EG329_002000 [Helotiales sp. DMI_Dod_QoI]